MTRGEPQEAWVAYVIVLGVVAAMMYGKYLIGRGDQDETISSNNKKSED
ncbi:MAG: hypothetical protein HOF69_05225 [Campylobacteraceae bacterium]|jgi:hypothetical protein|nr:hypothetical protein [Campylobacteraceae bacterium]MBT3882644.1 hypothetical protein [Campylobacteraceae bacterium]MBT4031214.1 hypothetical protein [Campylobacteraceae bacterium]MBT4179568.1 hypothetical protein [Campylobacteraceae bacterium]MBT4572905.1 hypothetical protein [Campylobacteraceae bacterium]